MQRRKELRDVHWIFINLCHFARAFCDDENELSLFDLAGPYAQLTLLGQARATPVLQTQKSASTESHNGRVQYRTQISTPERSISALHSVATPLLFDAKKARDAYEKVLKQFEVKRARGLNRRTARRLSVAAGEEGTRPAAGEGSRT